MSLLFTGRTDIYVFCFHRMMRTCIRQFSKIVKFRENVEPLVGKLIGEEFSI